MYSSRDEHGSLDTYTTTLQLTIYDTAYKNSRTWLALFPSLSPSLRRGSTSETPRTVLTRKHLTTGAQNRENYNEGRNAHVIIPHVPHLHHQRNASNGVKDPEASHTTGAQNREIYKEGNNADVIYHTNTNTRRREVSVVRWIESRQDPRPTQAAGLEAGNRKHYPVQDNREKQERLAAKGLHC